jgi:hypothetical protein
MQKIKTVPVFPSLSQDCPKLSQVCPKLEQQHIEKSGKVLISMLEKSSNNSKVNEIG